MRPSKLTQRVIKVFTEILSKEIEILVCTEAELILLLNSKLHPEERISYRTFQRYKALALQYGELDLDFMNERPHPDIDPLYLELYIQIKLALIRIKSNLVLNLMESRHGWQRYKWLLELRFKEWNIKYVEQDRFENAQPAAAELPLPEVKCTPQEAPVQTVATPVTPPPVEKPVEVQREDVKRSVEVEARQRIREVDRQPDEAVELLREMAGGLVEV